MTKEEIRDVIRKLNSNTMTSYEASYILPQALDALEEARREIKRLEEMSLAGTDVLRCPDCKRIAEDNVNCEHCGAKLRPWFAVNAVTLGESTT